MEENNRFYHHFIVFEAYLQRIDDNGNTEKTITTAQHIPVSVSICSMLKNFLMLTALFELMKKNLLQTG